MITGIVLAGGRSSRFGGDKLAADLDGRSVLAVTMAAVARIADAIVVAGPRLPDGWPGEDLPVALVPDVVAFEGPLAALVNVLSTAVQPGPSGLALVVGGDMPRLVPAVLAAMVEVLDVDPTIDAVLLGRPHATGPGAGRTGGRDGQLRRQVLPLALRVDAAGPAARDAIAAGDRSLRAMVERVAHAELPPGRWLGLDPAGGSLVDVDTTADLDRLR